MKKYYIWLIGLLLLLTSIQNLACATEHRVALVIGISDYQHSNRLINPTNDARDMAEALETCGFTVTVLTDATRKEMLTAIRKFGSEIKDRDSVGLFSFSGHGVQVNHVNYLLPVDARIDHENEVEDYCVRTSAVLRKMETASNKLNIIILDACRNNPFVGTTRASQQGLAQEMAPPSSLIAFATAPNATASDGPDLKNGLFTSYLLKHLNEPGLSLLDFFNKVGSEVEKASAGDQVPWVHHSPLPDFTFVAGGSTLIERPSSESTGGSLRIESEPSQAEVWLNGQRKGKAPLLIEELSEDRMEVQAKLQGYQDKKETVSIRPGKEVTVRLYLDPIATTGTLSVTSEPSGSNWYLDGALMGETPGELPEVKEGRHEILVKKEGYIDYINEIYLSAGDNLTVEAKLELEYNIINSNTQEKYITNSIGQEFVLIPAGTFMMGSGLSTEEVEMDYGGYAQNHEHEHPQHEVEITKPFYLQTTEVTVGQWREFVDETGYSDNDEWNDTYFHQTDVHPVTSISWYDAQKFIKWLNKREGVEKYRLPTEAEWEYACRAGTVTANYWGNDPHKVCRFGNVIDNSGAWSSSPPYNCNDGYKYTAPVGNYEKNLFGLYDMIGNVSEWCQDKYNRSFYSENQQTDPLYVGRADNRRVMRGGSYDSLRWDCRSAGRVMYTPSLRSNSWGFRLARSL